MFDFYEKLLAKLSTSLTTYWSGSVTSVIAAIVPVAAVLLTVYVILWGWAMLRGVISEPLSDAAQRMVRLAVITALALNIGYFNQLIADFLWQTPDALAARVATSHSGGQANMNFLDGLMMQFYQMGEAYFHRAEQDSSTVGVPNITMLLAGAAIIFAGVLCTGYAAFLFILSKVALAILIGLGPVFVLATLFEPTKRFFDAWLGQALNYVFLVVLAAGGLKLIVAVIGTYMGAAEVQAAQATPTLDHAIPAIAFGVIGFLVLMQLPSVASALGGGVAVGTLSAVAWTYGRTKGTMAAIRPTSLRRSLLRARSDVRIATHASKAVTVAGPMAIYRRVTTPRIGKVAQR